MLINELLVICCESNSINNGIGFLVVMFEMNLGREGFRLLLLGVIFGRMYIDVT